MVRNRARLGYLLESFYSSLKNILGQILILQISKPAYTQSLIGIGSWNASKPPYYPPNRIKLTLLT